MSVKDFLDRFPRVGVALSPLRERKGRSESPAQPYGHKPGYRHSCSEDWRWRPEGTKASVSGKVKIVPVSNCLA